MHEEGGQTVAPTGEQSEATYDSNCNCNCNFQDFYAEASLMAMPTVEKWASLKTYA